VAHTLGIIWPHSFRAPLAWPQADFRPAPQSPSAYAPRFRFRLIPPEAVVQTICEFRKVSPTKAAAGSYPLITKPAQRGRHHKSRTRNEHGALCADLRTTQYMLGGTILPSAERMKSCTLISCPSLGCCTQFLVWRIHFKKGATRFTKRVNWASSPYRSAAMLARRSNNPVPISG
jgi:hypothetical protein